MLWEIDYSEAAKFYFRDNDPYTFLLLAEIEKLRWYTNPLEGCTELSDDPGTFILSVLDHTVGFTFTGELIRVLFVKPD
jgi:hypothetical protein